MCFQVQRPVSILTVLTRIDQTVYELSEMVPSLVFEDVLTSFGIARGDDVKIFMLMLQDLDGKIVTIIAC